MKATPLLLVVSLAANLVFAAVSLRPAPRDASAERPTLQAPSATPPASADPSPPPPVTRRSLPDLGSPDVEAADFAALAARLREEGFPQEVVRRAIGAVLAHHFGERAHTTIRPRHNPVEYWKSPVYYSTPEESAARRKLEREQETMLKEIFGPDYNLSEERAARLYHGISAPTVEKMKKIFADYRELEEQIRDQAKPRDDIGAKLMLLEQEKRADLERTLTADELRVFDLRNGAATNRLHNHFGAFQPTEAEFLALHPIVQATIDAERGQGQRPTRESRLTQQARLDEEARRVLGEARYAEFEKTRRRP